ncbi:MAG: hypothetical protein ACTS8H_01090 [Arsenophonus sp. NC-PE1-MAG3]
MNLHQEGDVLVYCYSMVSRSGSTALPNIITDELMEWIRDNIWFHGHLGKGNFMAYYLSVIEIIHKSII